MSQHTLAFIPDRLNEEPVIYLSMTHSELKTVAMVSVGFWVPFGLLVSLLAGLGVLGVGVGAMLAFATMWVVGKQLRVLKRGRPRGYHVAAIHAWLEDHHLKKPTMIRCSAVWGIRRTRREGITRA